MAWATAQLVLQFALPAMAMGTDELSEEGLRAGTAGTQRPACCEKVWLLSQQHAGGGREAWELRIQFAQVSDSGIARLSTQSEPHGSQRPW